MSQPSTAIVPRIDHRRMVVRLAILVVLATVIPSNAARSGGVILPIARAIAELYGSEPGESARKLGAFLIPTLYQCICITAVTFMTAQPPNGLAAQLATQQGFPITWG